MVPDSALLHLMDRFGFSLAGGQQDAILAVSATRHDLVLCYDLASIVLHMDRYARHRRFCRIIP